MDGVKNLVVQKNVTVTFETLFLNELLNNFWSFFLESDKDSYNSRLSSLDSSSDTASDWSPRPGKSRPLLGISLSVDKAQRVSIRGNSKPVVLPINPFNKPPIENLIQSGQSFVQVIIFNLLV